MRPCAIFVAILLLIPYYSLGQVGKNLDLEIRTLKLIQYVKKKKAKIHFPKLYERALIYYRKGKNYMALKEGKLAKLNYRKSQKTCLIIAKRIKALKYKKDFEEAQKMVLRVKKEGGETITPNEYKLALKNLKLANKEAIKIGSDKAPQYLKDSMNYSQLALDLIEKKEGDFVVIDEEERGLVKEEKKYYRFFPHLTSNASTVGNFKASFEQIPGANGLNELVMNSFSIGFGSNFQVGTIPYFYTRETHNVNYNGKVTLFKFKNIHLGVGYSNIDFDIEGGPVKIQEEDGSITTVEFFVVETFSLMTNLFIPSWNLSLGLNLNKGKLTTSSSTINNDFTYPLEWILDANYKIGKYIITTGIGMIRSEALIPSKELPFSYGFSGTWLRPKAKWFPRITGGFNHIPAESNLTFLFSFDIN